MSALPWDEFDEDSEDNEGDSVRCQCCLRTLGVFEVLNGDGFCEDCA